MNEFQSCAARPSCNLKKSVVGIIVANQPPKNASVIRLKVTSRTSGFDKGTSLPSRDCPRRTITTSGNATIGRNPIGDSAASAPNTADIATASRLLEVLSPWRNRCTDASVIKSSSIVGESILPARHTGSEHTKKTAPCRRTNRTMRRLQPMRLMRKRRVAGRSSSNIRNVSTAVSPREIGPSTRRRKSPPV